MLWLAKFRLVSLIISSALGLTIIGINADVATFLSQAAVIHVDGQSYSLGLVDYPRLGIAVGAWTLIAFSSMVAVDILRTSFIIYLELCCLAFVSGLWFVVVVFTIVGFVILFHGACNDLGPVVFPGGETLISTGLTRFAFDRTTVLATRKACRETVASLVLALAVWLAVTAYAVALLVFAFRAETRGRPVWRSSVAAEDERLARTPLHASGKDGSAQDSISELRTHDECREQPSSQKLGGQEVQDTVPPMSVA
ncbi:uncharacterized protein BXZ73DRAFT_80417 [Epithele typhae]|uniref:uncharacterized protein n=1 Tax=Epithele typhae TaxID=378194 RepID=UPI002008448C|nr:uncharacterized protein BXZ73DRAFT_80417 [Epithele typhae]KAH9919207.1 hypothetical protein BXZ73DRAFT_80417 [Epithele typhae]